ncbi:MAG TPA: lysylphosphatidylglycerol synthase transmembrane domain-containing protein [Gemmatimonadales bacterium]|nr:lysylphosphatidylglycerol synthase transmembrane domain-containing protein [Gemmatimonadales bacterium]
MASLLTPKTLRRGFELFVVVSLVSYVGVFLYGNDAASFLPTLARIQWGWVLVGFCLASMDWIGGGFRLWILTRQIHPNPPLLGLMIAGGMGAWGSYVTPLQAGSSPLTVYSMKRVGVPVPKAITATLMSFIATVIFFAIGGPLALAFGAGKALGERGNVLGLSLLDLFKGSMGIFAILGVLLLTVMVAPAMVSRGIHRIAEALGRRSARVSARLEGLRAGIDQASDSMRAFNTPRGWLALFWATVISGPSHANKLLAGYVALRAVGIEANFVDVLLVQTLITFLLYFAPTPGASGVAELLSAAVMSVYVPRAIVPVYTLVWRCIISWFTIAAGFVIFSGWVRKGLKSIEVESS